jgi:hypothetical protein
MDENVRKQYISEIEAHIIELKSIKSHSLNRLEVIVTLVATTGIFLITTLINQEGISKIDLKMCVLLFCVSIMFNVLNHFISARCNSNIEGLFKQKLHDLRYNGDVNERYYNKQELDIRAWNFIINEFQIISIVSLFFGMTFGLTVFIGA